MKAQRKVLADKDITSSTQGFQINEEGSKEDSIGGIRNISNDEEAVRISVDNVVLNLISEMFRENSKDVEGTEI